MSRRRQIATLPATTLLALGTALSSTSHCLAQSPAPEGVLSAADGRISARAIGDLEISAGPETIAIRWIDTGITFLGDGNIVDLLAQAFERAKDIPVLFGQSGLGRVIAGLLDEKLWANSFILFGKPPLRTEYFPSLFGGTGLNQITVRMPERISELNGKDRPLTPAEWSAYGAILENYLYGEIKARRARGAADIEIRTVQVINPLGYMSPGQQARIVEFTKTFLVSLYRVRQRLEQEQKSVTVTGACGSNGCFAASRAIPWLDLLKMNPVDAMVMFDGRAFESDVALLIKALHERVAIINTAGDFPAAREFFASSLLPPMIASHECSRRLKEQFSRIRVFWAANSDGFAGLAIWMTRHIVMMKGESTSDMKEFRGKGLYQNLGRLSGLEFGAVLTRWLEAERSSVPMRREARGRSAARSREGPKGLKNPGDHEHHFGGCDPQDDWWCVPTENKFPVFPACPPWLPECWLPLGGNPPPCDPKREFCWPPEGPASPPCLLGEDCWRAAGSMRASALHCEVPDFLRYSVWPLFEQIPDLAAAPSPSLEILISK